jgi:hypothetical protein
VRRLAFCCLLAAACAVGEATSSEGAAVGSSPLGPDDVTVLAPLTSLETMTPRDLLLPDAIASQIGMLVEHFTAEDSLARLRVVCTRFDPKGQIRFVLQPLVVTDGVLGAQDAAVHVFYELPPAATRSMAARLASHSVDAPALAAQGTLSRVTFMRNTDVKGNAWSFGGFDVVNGQTSPLVVGRVGGSLQNVTINGTATSIAPAPSSDPTLGLLLDPVRLGILFEANPASAQAQVDKGISAALRSRTRRSSITIRRIARRAIWPRARAGLEFRSRARSRPRRCAPAVTWA